VRALGIAAVVIAACRSQPVEAPPVPALYEAPRPRAPQPPARTRIGTGDVPVALIGTGIRAGPGVEGALTMRAMVGALDGAAEAVLSGSDARGAAIELIDVDAGVVRWRNRTANQPAVAALGDRVIAAGGDTLVVLDRATGTERGRAKGRWLAAGAQTALVAVDGGVAVLGETLGPTRAVPGQAGDVAAVCDRWLLAWRGGQLERWDDGDAGYAATWSVAAPQPFRVDCGRGPLLVSGGAPRAVRALDAATGALLGGPVEAHDFWTARTGAGVELATEAGVERRDRALGPPTQLEPVQIDAWIASQGARRLVLGADGGPVLLDEHGARALAAPAGDPVVVAGARGFVVGPWRWPQVSQHARPARFDWPVDHATATPGPRPAPALLGDPPRADLPAVQPLGSSIAAQAGAWSVAAIAFAADAPERLYAIVAEARPTAAHGAGLAAFDLHAGRWSWWAPTACPPGMPVALVATAAVVACGAQGLTDGEGTVQATRSADGSSVWTWHGGTVDAVVAGGDAIAISSGAEAVILDAATGVERARWRTSDGFVPRLALVAHGADTRVASLEHGAIVTRSLAAGLLPIGAVAVGGRVTALVALGDRVATALADGSLYLDDGRAVGALAPAWLARGGLALALATNRLGDATVLGVDGDGIPRLGVALAGVSIAALGVRADAPGAPLALAATDGRALVVDLDGRVRAITRLPGADGPQLFTTVVDGVPVAGVVLAKPLRVIRIELP